MTNVFLNFQSTGNNDSKEPRKEWKVFVDGNSHIIQTVFERNNLKGGRALLLGAGNGNDIDIPLMERLFNEIVLVDIDETALGRFIMKTNNPSKFKTIVLDLSGVGSKAKSITNLKDHEIIAHLNSLQSDLDFSTIPGSFDFVMNCNYTTQLISPFFMSQLQPHPSKEVLKAINSCVERIITTIFDNICSVIKPGGIFLHSTDTIEFKHDRINNSLTPAAQIINKTTRGEIFKFHTYSNEMGELLSKGLGLSGAIVPAKVLQSYSKPPSLHFNYWTFTDSPEELRIYVVFLYTFIK